MFDFAYITMHYCILINACCFDVAPPLVFVYLTLYSATKTKLHCSWLPLIITKSISLNCFGSTEAHERAILKVADAVNNGEDEVGNAVACGRGDEAGTFARCHGKAEGARELGEVAASCRP